MIKHTPGPWTINANEGEEDIIDGPDGMPIACFDMRRDDKLRPLAECTANARLIAASPDLKKACEAISTFRVFFESWIPPGLGDGARAALQMIDDALKKTEGT